MPDHHPVAEAAGTPVAVAAWRGARCSAVGADSPAEDQPGEEVDTHPAAEVRTPGEEPPASGEGAGTQPAVPAGELLAAEELREEVLQRSCSDHAGESLPEELPEGEEVAASAGEEHRGVVHIPAEEAVHPEAAASAAAVGHTPAAEGEVPSAEAAGRIPAEGAPAVPAVAGVGAHIPAEERTLGGAPEEVPGEAEVVLHTPAVVEAEHTPAEGGHTGRWERELRKVVV